jgi:hypothetical protein
MIAMLLGLHGRNPSETISSPFLAGYPVGPASTVSAILVRLHCESASSGTR